MILSYETGVNEFVPINKQMQLLGWDGFELDYHTLQLAVACFEGNSTKTAF